MPDQSPPSETMKRFLRSQLSRDETRTLVEGLIKEGSRSRESPPVLRYRDRPGKTEGDKYDSTFDGLFGFLDRLAGRLQREKENAEAQWRMLEAHPHPRRLMLVQNQKALQTWGLFDRILRESREAVALDARRAFEFAELALAIVTKLDPAVYGEPHVADFQGAALGALGNAQRLLNDFEAAETSLRQAAKWLARGTHESMDEAELMGLEASLLRDMGAFEQAASCLGRALTLYRRIRDPHLEGKTLIRQAEILGHVDPQHGIGLLQQGIPLLEHGRDAALELTARHHLIWFMNDAGRPWHASALLEASRGLYSSSPDPFVRLEGRWLEGRIAQASEYFPEAEQIFLEVWLRLIDRERPLDFTLLTLDLADVHVAQGQLNYARLLVREFYRMLAERGMHREGLLAWRVLREALARKTATSDLFQQAALYYRRAWRRPLRSTRSIPLRREPRPPDN